MQSCVAILSKINNLGNELRRILPKLNFVEILNDTDNEKLYKSEIIIADYDLINPHLCKLKNTKWIQGTWAGVDTLVPYKNIINEDLIITRFSGIHFGRLMSEYVVANIINYERGLFNVYENKKKQLWNRDGKIETHRTINDLKIGILGIGSIGNHIAKTLNMFGAKIWGFGRREKLPENEEYKHYESYCNKEKLPFLLKNCDYIVNVLPNTDETKGLLNDDILKNCEGKNVVFINVGRGSIISDEDLIKSLENKCIEAAILDVFNEEPLPSNHKLWTMDQVFITPHISGISRAKDVAEQFANNLELYLSGKQVPNQFYREKSY